LQIVLFYLFLFTSIDVYANGAWTTMIIVHAFPLIAGFFRGFGRFSVYAAVSFLLQRLIFFKYIYLELRMKIAK
jgi:hypothetical protein